MEDRLYKQLYKTDSTAARNLFANDPREQYSGMLGKIQRSGSDPVKLKGTYHPYLDSLQGILRFAKPDPKVSASLQQLTAMQHKLQDADQASEFIRQRKELIKQYLSQYPHLPHGLKDTYDKYNRDLYYYNTQIREYKDLVDDPDKALKASLNALRKVPAFRSFMQQNSLLNGLFGSPQIPGAMPSIEGLATRDQMQSVIGSQLAGGGTNASSAVSNNIQRARQELNQLQDKMLANGAGANGTDLADNFTPNTQKSKPFLKRLEFGCNIQHAAATSSLPSISTIGLSAGYKFTDNISSGIGMAYQLGLGKDLNHIHPSNQGIGLRSYLNIRAKKSFWFTAGFEENYYHRFSNLQTLRNVNLWQESILAGVTKKIRIGKKENNVQLLYDVLATQQRPRTQPLKFRVGYKL
jgi:hypothetical protein